VKNILVTGGAGFIGANFVPYFLEKNPDCSIITLDKLTYAGNLTHLADVIHHPRHKFIQGDICNAEMVQHIFKEYHIQGVVHFAAESHVDNSISGPRVFVETNVMGTFVLLETARHAWMNGPHKIKDHAYYNRFHHVSTDEVYGSLGQIGAFTETTPYAPNSPYSATKASSDFLVRSYFHTYGLNVVTTNCSNNFGPKQHKEKLIPTIIRKALASEPIPIYGDGKNVRDWLYVLDHCEAIDLVFHQGKTGETYNIGSENEVENLKLAQKICHILDSLQPRTDGNSYTSLITFVPDRPGHDQRYAIDATKIQEALGWRSGTAFADSLRDTIQWYLSTPNKPLRTAT
jgi:dTDP-glucose 4,6-dehydratase